MASLQEKQINSRNNKNVPPTYEGSSFVFEGTKIQLDKSSWHFDETERTLDTYSIWNPNHHEEIANRLKGGQIAAFYLMGNFGVVEIRKPEVREFDPIFEKIKQRPREQNLVAFMNPEDTLDFIDIDKLPDELKNLKWAGKRMDLYPKGALHAVLPLKKNAEIDQYVIREADKTLATFWIKGHWGYELLGDKLRKKIKRGVLGGGSLNVHGEEPSYTTSELFNEFEKKPEWQKNIAFIVFDEIAEEGNIGRSQTMISYESYPAETRRIGSLTPQQIEMQNGIPIKVDSERIKTDPKYFASSKTKYNKRNDEVSDVRVNAVMDKIQRYKEYYSKNFKRGFNF